MECEVCKVQVTKKNRADHDSGRKHKNNLNPDEICEVCKVKVNEKNRASHCYGRKHKHNLKKKAEREEKKRNIIKITLNSSTEVEDLEATQNKASNIENTNKSSKNPSQLDKRKITYENSPGQSKKRSIFSPTTKSNKKNTSSEISPGPEQQSVDILQVNMPNDSNQNNSENWNRREDSFYVGTMPAENQHKAYWNRGHPNSGFRRPPRGNLRQFNNPNARRQSWWNNYQNPNKWNIDSSGWHPPLKNNRYFQSPYPDSNPNDANPFFLDTGGSYESFDSNENYCTFKTVQYPLENTAIPQSNPMDSFTPKDAEKVETGGSEVNVEKAHEEMKVPKAKPLRRSNQSVRAIRNASLAIRNSVDSDDAQDVTGDREKKNSQTENAKGKRIAHWINPSNSKDEAEVRRLVTEFSKSKKKENLLRLKQQSESRIDRRDSASDEISLTMDTLTSAVEVDDSVISLQDISWDIPAQVPSRIKKKGVSSNSEKRSLNLESPLCSDSPNSNRSIANFSKSKRSSLQTEASPKVMSSDRKRKSSTEKSTSKSKKPISATNRESVLDAVIRGNRDSSLSPEPSVKSKKNQSHVEESAPETIVPKKEPVDSIENSQNQSYTKAFDLNDFLQCQEGGLENNCKTEATMTPVESLINLFASGNVKVKNEFDDPHIDAIRTLDPAVLNKVCDDQPATNPSASQARVPSPAVEHPSGKPHPSVTGSLKAILKELQKISTKERKIKDSLQEADQKIQEYQLLLDEWKTKKIKIQSEEEILGHQRNTLVKSMNDLVTEDFTVPNFQENTEFDSVDITSNDPCPSNSSPCASNNLLSVPLTSNPVSLSQNSNYEQGGVLTPGISVNAPVENGRQTIETVEEEIAIIPVPSKSDRIPVINLDEDPVEQIYVSGTALNENCLDDKLSKWEVLAAHEVVVNSIQVFEDSLYTCSNDSTARRFNLKNLSKTVTYHHEKKNVTQLCVEKVNGVTVVFTVCAASNSITAFKAENGTILNTFTFVNNIASMCRGRDKIYAGLRDGSIFTCTYKERKEIVNIGDNLRSIGLTYQGCISILVTLAINGSVSIRDAERNGLLIRTVKSVKNVPLFMTVHGDCIYLSGSGVLIVLEIGTAKCIGQYDRLAPYTSLTAYHGYIFTISYSGLVRCYSQDEKAVQVYYGAGNTSLTCINVYNDWVFTGNRFGAVDVFKFNPHTLLPCQMGKCDMIFAREKDLELHTLSGKDHDLPSAGSKCSWRTCRTTMPRSCKLEVIKCHIREHIKALQFQDHQTLYNFSL